jgi:hypothetical protein
LQVTPPHIIEAHCLGSYMCSWLSLFY